MHCFRTLRLVAPTVTQWIVPECSLLVFAAGACGRLLLLALLPALPPVTGSDRCCWSLLLGAPGVVIRCCCWSLLLTAAAVCCCYSLSLVSACIQCSCSLVLFADVGHCCWSLPHNAAARRCCWSLLPSLHLVNLDCCCCGHIHWSLLLACATVASAGHSFCLLSLVTGTARRFRSQLLFAAAGRGGRLLLLVVAADRAALYCWRSVPLIPTAGR